MLTRQAHRNKLLNWVCVHCLDEMTIAFFFCRCCCSGDWTVELANKRMLCEEEIPLP